MKVLGAGTTGRAHNSSRGGVAFAAVATANAGSCLNSHVLLLNAHYVATCVVTVRRAFTLLCKRDQHRRPIAEVIHVEDGRYVSYDFDDWAGLSAFKHEFEPDGHDWIRTVRLHLVVPRVIRVLTFSKLPKQEVKLNRRNVFARDGNTCQYCGKRFSTSELSLDHVVPRALGGQTTWTNLVCACVRCNVRKGGRTPDQARVTLVRPPVKPRRNPVVTVTLADHRYASWKQFLDTAYWDVELK